MNIKSHSSMKRFVAGTLLVLAFHTVALAQDKLQKIDELMSRYAKYQQFNGAVLVSDHGKVIYRKGFGLANMEWNIPNEPDTKFRLGSITKQFTATLILQLVEQGKIKLEGKVSDYLPDYRPDTGAGMTIHHLLSHTSGLPNYTAQPGFFQNISRNPFKVADFVKQYASGDLEFEPGSKFNYSNSGYFLLGAIVEKVTGKPYEQVLKEKITEPLGMRNTGYDHYDKVLSKRAAGYVKTASGYENAPYLDMSIPYAAGSLYSTVEDLFLWDQALYGEKVLSAASKELMFKPNLQNYGYGFGIRKATLGPTKLVVPIIEHNGGINGFSTIIERLVGDNSLVVLLDNTSQGRYLDGIALGITNILYEQPYETPKQSIAEALFGIIGEKDVATAIKRYRELKATQASDYDFREMELNTLGYRLMLTNKVAEAIEIFKLNVEAYPQAFNTYDSLGEAYMRHGDKELAITNYKRSLELNPQNAGATRALAELSGEQKAATADANAYQAFAGAYELAPNFVIAITVEDGKLMWDPLESTCRHASLSIL